MDKFDHEILSVLLADGRVTWSHLSRLVGLSASACQRRVEAMAEQGIIDHFTVRLNDAALGHSVKAFVSVRVERKDRIHADKLRRWIQDHPQILACHMLSGDIDYLLEVVATDLPAFGRFIDEELLSIPSVKDASSSIVLSQVKVGRGGLNQRGRSDVPDRPISAAQRSNSEMKACAKVAPASRE